MSKIKYLSFIAVALYGATSFLSSCSNDDDDFDVDCFVCSYQELNSKCTVNGQSFHAGTSYAQFLGDTRGSFLNMSMHKDGGGVDPQDGSTIDLTISPYTGPSIDDIKVGQSLQLADGTDKIDYWYNNVIFSLSQITSVHYTEYVSGSVTCTKKNGTETTLTFKEVVLLNSKDDSKVTINGTFVCDQYRFD